MKAMRILLGIIIVVISFNVPVFARTGTVTIGGSDFGITFVGNSIAQQKFIAPGIGSLLIYSTVFYTHQRINIDFSGQAINFSDQPVQFHIELDPFPFNLSDRYQEVLYDPPEGVEIYMASHFGVRTWNNNLFIHPVEQDGFIMHTFTNPGSWSSFAGVEPGTLFPEHDVYARAFDRWELVNPGNLEFGEELNFYLSPKSNFSFHNRAVLNITPIPSGLLLFGSCLIPFAIYRRKKSVH